MYRVIFYKASDMDKLCEDLTRTILDALSHGKNVTNPVLDFAPIHLANVILGLEDVKQRESKVASEVWLIKPSLDTDLQLFNKIIRYNLLERKITYRYLIPREDEVITQWQRFVRDLRLDPKQQGTLEVRTLESYFIESEVVIYDPYSAQEEVLIMSPREREHVFWYSVGKTRGERIRKRYEALWKDPTSKPLAESM